MLAKNINGLAKRSAFKKIKNGGKYDRKKKI